MSPLSTSVQMTLARLAATAATTDDTPVPAANSSSVLPSTTAGLSTTMSARMNAPLHTCIPTRDTHVDRMCEMVTETGLAPVEQNSVVIREQSPAEEGKESRGLFYTLF